MDIKTLESFSLADAISFHDELNPKLWAGMKLRPEVRKQLKKIADDFMDELGISGLDVTDVTVSGSNAAYSYTPHSDLDLHIIVDMSDMPNDEVYKELFNAKKNLYNEAHDITIHGVPIEVYVQDSSQPVVSLGEYSIKDNDWIKLPTKRRANLDQTATKSKYNKLLDTINSAIKSNNLKKINKTIKKIRQYRQAGLDKGGEFGPENLAYKVLRSQGYINKLYQLRDKLHSEILTIENMYQNPEKVQEGTNDYLWHGSKSEHKILYPRQAVDTGGAEGSNKNAVYATPNAKFAIAMGLTTPGSDTGMFPNDSQMVLFSGNIRKGQMVYLHKVPKDLFIKHNGREWYSKPEVKEVTPIEVVAVPVDKWLHLIRQATPQDWELRKKYMKKQDVDEAVHPDVTSKNYFLDPTENVRMGDFEFNARTFTGALGDPNARGLQIRAYDPKLPKGSGSIGSADFIVKSDKKGNQWLESDDTEVNDEYRGKGVAAMMYAFAKTLGNDIKSSPYQSQKGREMWKKWGKDAEHLAKESVEEGSLNEYRDRMYQYLKSIVPGFPDYVVKDWLYANFARGATQGPGWSFDTIGKDIPKILKDIGLSVDTKWKLVPNMKFTMDMWEPKTLKRLQARAGGSSKTTDPDVHIPAKDAERHATQAALAKQQGGVRKEPVILIKTPQGYQLLEGWHRTIQHFAKYPEGYTGPAYIAVAQGQQDMAEDLTQQYASEKTPVISPYSGVKDRQFRGAIAEELIKLEASYKGNLGMMEMMKFFKVATPEEKTLMKQLISQGKQEEAWQLLQKVTDVELVEAFDLPYKLKWEKGEHGDYDALATLDDGTFLSIMFNNEYKNTWMVEFYRNNSQEVTGEGDAQRIFATVLTAIEHFIKKKKPVSLFFSAVKEDDPKGSRARLYNTLVNRYATNLGYSVTTRNDDRGMSFKLTRQVNEASGYIPSEKEKNDPRFKTALTVDVKPDSIKKNAKAFYWKTSRAGIPPTARANGKF